MTASFTLSMALAITFQTSSYQPPQAGMGSGSGEKTMNDEDPVITYLQNRINEIEASRYGEEERATPGLLAILHREIEKRKNELCRK